MVFEYSVTFQSVLTLIGLITVVFLLFFLIISSILIVLLVYALKTGIVPFPRFLKAGILFFETFMIWFIRVAGINDTDFWRFMAGLQNNLNKQAFSEVPIDKRAVFLPQCLRSAKCPAHLEPEGLKCRSCGLCTVGQAHRVLQGLGYRVFIVPGSSFIGRMIKKYRIKGVIGVGCLIEIKDGLEMADKAGYVAMGVVSDKDGCVETSVNWESVYEIAMLGLDPASFPDSILEFLPASEEPRA
ncbi:MAG: DUF116 domain-containing protein [Methanospirillaceae archaeon]|nr:DUF116 domain-containing protein [Methanospirillaceae archaeon]